VTLSQASSVPRLRLRTFGATALERQLDDGSWAPLARSGKVLALLVYLSASEGRPVTREVAADLLWGDEVPERARASLRQALHTLRQQLGDAPLHADRETVRLEAGHVEIERDDFVAAARAGSLTAMLDVYRGPYCPRLEVGTSSAFERWVSSERSRFERQLLGEAERTVPQIIGAGDLALGERLARQLMAVMPDQPAVAILHFDALVAAGDIAEARERLEGARAALEGSEQEVPAAITDRLARARRLGNPAVTESSGTLSALGQVLVGRADQMATLFREAEVAREEGARRVLLTGPAGIGKTRLLDEFEARMRLRGARVVRVRLLPGMRDVRYSSLTDVIRALVVLPGAIGVSEHTAGTLVALLPELRSTFPAAPLNPRAEADASRALRDAYGDLLAAVSERRLVVLLLDDLQFSDAQSRAVINAVSRPAALKLLEVLSARPLVDAESVSPDARVEVPPLDASEIRAVLQDVGSLPIHSGSVALLDQLAERTRGIPQLLLQTVRAAASDGLLAVQGGVWQFADEARLARAVDQLSAPDASLQQLTPPARRLLDLLTAWSRPLDEGDLLGVAAEDVPALAPEVVRDALRQLEALGLVQSRDATWRIAHDTIADAVLRQANGSLVESPVEPILRYWAQPSRLSTSVLEHLALVLGSVGARAQAGALVRRASAMPELRESGVRGRRLARTVARASGHPEWEQYLYSRIGWLARLGDTGRAVLAGTGALAGAGLVWLVLMLQPRVEIQVEPMVEHYYGGEFPGEFAVLPRVVLVNGFGQVHDRAGTITARLRGGQLFGGTVAPLDSGRAQFTHLVFKYASTETEIRPMFMEFVGPWYTRATSVPLRGAWRPDAADRFRVRSLVYQQNRLEAPFEVEAQLGDSLRFDMIFEYTTIMSTANYIVAAAPIWGDRTRATIRLAGLPRPVQDAWRNVTFSVPPPPAPGIYYVVVLFGAEDTADHMFSGTTWTIGAPAWNDGNDIADFGPSQFESLRHTGLLVAPGHRLKTPRFRQAEARLGEQVLERETDPEWAAEGSEWHGTAIRVIVR
jgi:DNA-binding SARP family transcriptional activator